MSNIALRLAGPAVISYKGQTFASKADIQLNLENSTFDVAVDAYGTIDKRSTAKIGSLRFTPTGKWEALAILWPYGGGRVIGQLTTPVKTFVAGGVSTATDVITLAAHGFTDGAAVRFFTFDTIPTGLTAGTLYYLHVLTADTFSVHATRADAIANASLVNITTTGTGPHRVIEQEPLVITTAENETYTFHVAAVSQMPDVIGAATETLIGEVQFDFFRKANEAATVDASMYTISTGTFTPPNVDPADILTQPYTFTWGAAPWSGVGTIDGIRWSFPLSTEDVGDDANGPQAKRITDVQCTIKAKPLNITPSAVVAKLLLQGTGASRGARVGTADSFVMTGTGVLVTGYGAGLRSSPLAAGRSADRIGELEWFASRTFTGGAPNPLFALGTGA